MAKYTVLFRFHYGRAYQQLSDQEREAARAAKPMEQLFKKWKSEGIKLKGSMTCSSHPDGFAHHLLFEVDSFEQMRQMDVDLFLGEAGRAIEKFDFHIGTPRAEERWAEL